MDCDSPERRSFIKYSLILATGLILGPRLSMASTTSTLCSSAATQERQFPLSLTDDMQSLPMVYVPDDVTVTLTVNNQTSGDARLIWPDGSQSLNIPPEQTTVLHFQAQRARQAYYQAMIDRDGETQLLRGEFLVAG